MEQLAHEGMELAEAQENFGMGIICAQQVFAHFSERFGLSPDDAMRAASYNRGKLTALGGVGVKRANQVFSAIRLAEKDCKDKDGFLITVLNKKELEDTYTWHNGQWVILNADQIAKYVGKQVRIRSPYTCKTAAPHFCETCVGLTIAKFPNGIHNFVAAISSREMLLFMKAMHGRSLATTPLNPSISFS